MPPKKSKQTGRSRLWAPLIAVVVVTLGWLLWSVVGPVWNRNNQNPYLYIRTGATFSEVISGLVAGRFIQDETIFRLMAEQVGYPAHVKPGKYHIKPGMSHLAILRMLRNGTQDPVRLVINKIRTKRDFISFVCSRTEADSIELRRLLEDNNYLNQYGLDSNTALCAVLPDTYEVWWNTSARKVFDRLAEYYRRYWTAERKSLAKQQGLSVTQCITLAAIVEEETNNLAEKPLIASVYLNRLRKLMKLQADPTARFAAGDFSLRRITQTQTALASPYNTYFTIGLPPGPICTPSKQTIDAVLHAPETTYLFFCAKEDFSGQHRFASDYATHMENARRYQTALNQRGIR